MYGIESLDINKKALLTSCRHRCFTSGLEDPSRNKHDYFRSLFLMRVSDAIAHSIFHSIREELDTH